MVPDAIVNAIEARETEKAGVQQELIPEVAAAALDLGDAELDLDEGLERQPELPMLIGYDPSETFIGTCQGCSSQLEMAEGCMKCHVWGFSECGRNNRSDWRMLQRPRTKVPGLSFFADG